MCYKSVREDIGVSQKEFSVRYGVPLESLKNWEQGRRVPSGPAKTLLKLIASHPKAVERALKNA